MLSGFGDFVDKSLKILGSCVQVFWVLSCVDWQVVNQCLGDIMLIQNVGNFLPANVGWYSRKLVSLPMLTFIVQKQEILNQSTVWLMAIFNLLGGDV